MIFSLVLMLIFVILIALFIGKNLGNSCPVWFFKSFDSTNVAIIIFLAFAAGIVFSLICVFIGKINLSSKNSKKNDEGKNEKNKEKKSLIKKIKSETNQESSENKSEVLTTEKSTEEKDVKRKKTFFKK